MSECHKPHCYRNKICEYFYKVKKINNSITFWLNICFKDPAVHSRSDLVFSLFHLANSSPSYRHSASVVGRTEAVV